MIRRIRDLLYDQGFTISGARNKLQELVQGERDKRKAGEVMLEGVEVIEVEDSGFDEFEDLGAEDDNSPASQKLLFVRRELSEIRDLLSAAY